MWPFPKTPEYTTKETAPAAGGDYVCVAIPPSPTPAPTPAPSPPAAKVRALMLLEIGSPEMTGHESVALGDRIILSVPSGATSARIAFAPPCTSEALAAAPIDDASDCDCRALVPGGQIEVRPLWVRLTDAPLPRDAAKSTLIVIFEEATAR